MSTVTRKTLLKGGMAGAAAAAALPFAKSTVFASDGEHLAVHAHARVTGAPGSLDVNVDAAGKRDALSGSGWDTPDADGANQHGACLFAQRGELEGQEIRVHGAVLLANNPANLGVPIKTTANLETGDVTFVFGSVTFTGRGVVIKVD
jgi:hypothetical protein